MNRVSKIYVRAKAHARARQISQIDGAHFTISVTEVAEKGRANQAIRQVLAEQLGVPQTSLSLYSGHRSSRKVFILNT